MYNMCWIYNEPKQLSICQRQCFTKFFLTQISLDRLVQSCSSTLMLFTRKETILCVAFNVIFQRKAWKIQNLPYHFYIFFLCRSMVISVVTDSVFTNICCYKVGKREKLQKNQFFLYSEPKGRIHNACCRGCFFWFCL